jgi:ATP-dependent Clp protease ATP-binding subunit ClpB
MAVDSKPEELDEIDRRLVQLKIEREALTRETDAGSQARLANLEGELADLQKQSDDITARWRAEKEKLGTAAQAREALDRLRSELEVAQRNGDFGRAGEIQYGQIPAVERQLAEAEAAAQDKLTPEVVDAEQIAAVVSRWTGVPVEKMLEGERAKLLQMEDRLQERVVGQQEALAAVSDAVRRARAGLKDPARPIGSFLFLGPHGRRQDELTKALAEFLFDDEAAVTRMDMSEYMEKHSVSRMIGRPPGYVGYDEGGRPDGERAAAALPGRAVRRGREGAPGRLQRAAAGAGRRAADRRSGPHGRLPQHPDHHDQQHGRGVHRRPARRAGSRERAAAGDGRGAPQLPARVPEPAGRDHPVPPPGAREHGSIVRIQLQRVEKLLADRRMAIALDPSAEAWLAERGYDPVYGARPLKRVIQKELVDPIARRLLAGDLSDGDVIQVTGGEAGLEIGRAQVH